ncbi:MAG TPA: hypothetical protein VNO26_01890 [Candidatus Limnocylindria bacterium]|nr:hypothetical protein [Candidatus Limnocylindria bacterium]
MSIAYQVMGEGPFDVVFVPGFVSHLDFLWEIPTIARTWHRVASFSRPRGCDASARVIW